ncbi:MAG: adenylate/guanylate cyclase domain-containing protein [Flavobacteriales bacterium]|nr:adenylate/guanylate cyclase domain-containing protein [Flavobacteriales bacterium]MBP6697611.1 adenylate/guanylate cyclase domain-containing protein [Flavobacteriales bacterium]
MAGKFNTYRFADYKEKVIDLLKRVTTVSVGVLHSRSVMGVAFTYLQRLTLLSAKHRSRIKRIIPFGIIWLGFGVVYCLVEKGFMGRMAHCPPSGPSGKPYDFQTALIIKSLSTGVMGLLMGTMESYFLARLFRRRSFLLHIASKTVIYVLATILFLIGVNTIQYSWYLDLPPAHPEILRIHLYLLRDYSFWSIIAYIGAVVVVSLVYADFSHHIGHGVLRTLFTGRYHTPKEEERIFMFLDMKSSTTIAEELGHVKYFGLLNRYYADMSDAILASSGEICQYVGDEVVITWTLEKGLRGNDCLECFFRIKEHLSAQAATYQKDFGRVPDFKAGLHCGHVTTGEIGTVRKDIIFTGDVMNTTARIQSLCNENGVDLLVSDAMMTRMRVSGDYQVRELGARELKGKDERVKLFTVWKRSLPQAGADARRA